MFCYVRFVNEKHIIDFIQIAETIIGSQTTQNVAIVRWDQIRSLKTEWSPVVQMAYLPLKANLFCLNSDQKKKNRFEILDW